MCINDICKLSVLAEIGLFEYIMWDKYTIRIVFDCKCKLTGSKICGKGEMEENW